MSDNENLAMPHPGLSSFSGSENRAKEFGFGGITVRKRVPISAIWLYPSLFSNAYRDEDEHLVDGDAVQLFRKEEIEVE